MNDLHGYEDDLTLSMSATRLNSGEPTGANEDRLAQIMDQYLVSLEEGAPIDLESLIAQHPEFADEIRSMSESLELLHHATKQMRPTSSQKSKLPTTPKRLGDFEIGSEIGRGGMGVVYEARQLSLERQVALKVLPFAAMWDQKQIARFRNEALAAAQLHHPNIVPVFAVGQERGVHFYAMQLIDGRSLDQVVHQLRREGQLRKDGEVKQGDWPPGPVRTKPQVMESTAFGQTTEAANQAASDLSAQHSHDRNGYCRAIAKFGRQAAEALHHAHEYGVVHRDIKPSNLMVDDNAKLWITDFGLARIQSSPGVTMTGDVVGTLRYMSPEQAAGQTALVDARTDIYGLGATLYELLTLQPAFPGEDRNTVLRDIESSEPKPPRAINPSIPVDLETIVTQAMSKSRDSRYTTAQALAEDLKRFLDGKPTLARRPTLIDRTAKWMRRHRSIATLAAVFMVTLTIGSIFAALKIAGEQAKTQAALVEAKDNLARAEEHFAQARSVVDRFGIQLADQLQETPGTEQIRQHLLVETLKYYREFAEQIGGQLDIQDQLAMTHLKTGVVTAKLGANRRAMAEYQAGQRLLQQLLEQDPTNSQLRSQLALSRNNMAILFAAAGDLETAKREYGLAIAEQQQLVADAPANIEYTNQLAESYLNLGTLLGESNQTDEAVASLHEAITILKNTYQAAPKHTGHGRSLAMAYNNLGYLQRKADPTSAEQSAHEAVELLERICQTPDASGECLADLSLCYGNLAAIQTAANRTDDAIGSYQRAITLRESLVRTSPGVVRYRSELAANLNNLALLSIRTGDTAAASDAFDRANQIFATLIDDYPDQAAYASGWAALLNNQGLALANSGRPEVAIRAYKQAIAAQERVRQQLPESKNVRESLSRIYYNYSKALQQGDRPAEAAKQALARRVLWRDNGERLFSVAVELAQIAASDRHLIDDNASKHNLDKLSENLSDEVITTLALALQAGYRPKTKLSQDARFRHWHDDPSYRELAEASNRELATTNSPQQPL